MRAQKVKESKCYPLTVVQEMLCSDYCKQPVEDNTSSLDIGDDMPF